MSTDTERLKLLLERNAAKTCSYDEFVELCENVSNSRDADITGVLDQFYESLGSQTSETDVAWDYIFKQITDTPQRAKTIVPLRQVSWMQIGVAAAVALVVGLFTIYLLIHHPVSDAAMSEFASLSKIKAPIVNKATMKLPDGKVVQVDSLTSGNALTIGFELNKTGTVTALRRTALPKDDRINTLTNPRGSSVADLVLTDGTHVWLNAASSISFPSAFGKDQRLVSITGEAYFEVSHETNRPFIVRKHQEAVRVMGTRFDIKVYEEDQDDEVSLLEGSVQAGNGRTIVLLRPGETASFGDSMSVRTPPDITSAIAWKNGVFSFRNAGIRSIMREISRWYDITIVYESVPEGTFSGKVSRNTDLSHLGQILQQSGVKFTLDGSVLTIRR